MNQNKSSNLLDWSTGRRDGTNHYPYHSKDLKIGKKPIVCLDRKQDVEDSWLLTATYDVKNMCTTEDKREKVCTDIGHFPLTPNHMNPSNASAQSQSD